MPSVSHRSLMKMGKDGLVTTIPKSWADFYMLRAGDKVQVIANGELRVRPKREMCPHGQFQPTTTNEAADKGIPNK